MLRSAVVVTAVALVGACGAATGGQSALDKGPVGSGPTVTSPATTAPSSTQKNIDPIAGRYTPVERNGSVPTPHIRAQVEPFAKPVVYPDHITVRILSVHQSVSKGRGPGEIAGQPLTTMRIRFGNSSKKPINLTQVVVTVVYGAEGRLASPNYEAGEQDFHSVVAPGKSATATYAFSIPHSGLSHVVMRVDFDGLHAAATFTGPLS